MLCCVALALKSRDELVASPDPAARLQPRRLPPLDASALVAAAAAVAPRIPSALYELVLAHPLDARVSRAAVLDAPVRDAPPARGPRGR